MNVKTIVQYRTRAAGRKDANGNQGTHTDGPFYVCSVDESIADQVVKELNAKTVAGYTHVAEPNKFYATVEEFQKLETERAKAAAMDKIYGKLSDEEIASLSLPPRPVAKPAQLLQTVPPAVVANADKLE